jgi:ABC-type hemin transport system ATPase subunit
MDIEFVRLSVDVRVVRTKAERKDKELATKRILHNAHGAARCGHLLAILGASGAGKSTLVSSVANHMVMNQSNHPMLMIIC